MRDLPIRESSRPKIKSIKISRQLAKAEDTIEVVLIAQPKGRALFSIAEVNNVADITMKEDTDNPGTYVGRYIVQVGDNAVGAAVSIVFTNENYQTLCTQARQRVTIDTVPPRIHEMCVIPKIVRNGRRFTLKVTAEPNCNVAADFSQLDSTHKRQ